MINRWTLGRTPLVLNAKEAMRIAESHGCDGIVVDMGAPHALELQHIEYQPFLVLPESKQTSGGPYEAVGRVSYSLLRAVRSVPAPADSKRAPASPAISEAPTTSFHPEPSATPSTEVHVDLRGWTFHYLEPLPGPELTAQASRELQSFAEVEWACFVSGAASQTPEHFRPLLALKLDPRMAHRIHDIASHLNKKMGPLTWELALLSAPDIIARIRPHAFSFYP